MVFDLNCKPLVIRIKRRTSGHCPGFEHSIELDTKIVVHSCRIMLLDDEAATVGRLDFDLSAWL